ncbi:MAG: hypothetical protein HOP06_10100 [Methylotenera sp.]|nr:hypothetical protein [Methylotenera sp.]
MAGANVEIKLKLNDAASTGLKKIAKEAEQAATKSSKAAEQMAKKSATAVEQSVSKSRSAYEKLASARETLGIRSEKAVQNEIKQTEAAYNRMARSGVVSAKALAQAQAASISKVRELRKELGETEKGFTRLQKLGGIGVGVAAGAYVAKRSLDKPIDFDRQVRLVSNNVFSGTDRKDGNNQVLASVRAAQQAAGGLGKQDEVLAGLNALVGSGAFGSGQAGFRSSSSLLGGLNNIALGNNSSLEDIANLAISAKQNLKLKDSEILPFIGKAVASGKEGGFELKDMVNYLPSQMAKSTELGLRGGIELLAANQAARISAGTASEAGNNVDNLLSKLTSHDTIQAFQKNDVDIIKKMAAGRLQGKSALETFIDETVKIGEKDKNFAKLREKLKTAKGQEKEDTIRAVMAILQRKGFSAVLPDRQAQGAFLGIAQNREKFDGIKINLTALDGTEVIKQDAANVIDSVSGQSEALANNKDAAASATLSAIDGPLKNMLKDVNSLSVAHPVLTTATYTAATALGILTAAAGANTLLGGGKGTSLLPKALPSLAGAGAGIGSALTGAATLSATTAAGVGIAGAGGYLIGSEIVNPAINAVDKNFGTGIGNSIGRTVALWLAPFSATARTAIVNDIKGKSPEDKKVKIEQMIGLSPGLTLVKMTTQAVGELISKVTTGNIHHGAP